MLRPQILHDSDRQQTVICDSCQRVCTSIPPTNAGSRARTQAVRRHHPKIDAPQAWYYRAEFSDAGEVSCVCKTPAAKPSRCVFDAYRTARRDILSREGISAKPSPKTLPAPSPQRKLDGKRDGKLGTEIPMNALISLHTDLEAARYEMNARTTAKPEKPAGVPTEQAAS